MAQPRTLCIPIYSNGSTPEIAVNGGDVVYFVNLNTYIAQVFLPAIFDCPPDSPITIPAADSDGSFYISEPLKVNATHTAPTYPYQSVLIIPGQSTFSMDDTIDVGDAMEEMEVADARAADGNSRPLTITIDQNAKVSYAHPTSNDTIRWVNLASQDVALTDLPPIFVGGPLDEPVVVPPLKDEPKGKGFFPIDPKAKAFPEPGTYGFTYHSDFTGSGRFVNQNDTIDVDA
jgi:hypothetical protein